MSNKEYGIHVGREEISLYKEPGNTSPIDGTVVLKVTPDTIIAKGDEYDRETGLLRGTSVSSKTRIVEDSLKIIEKISEGADFFDFIKEEKSFNPSVWYPG